MRIDFSAEQAQIIGWFMKHQAENGLRQAAEMKAQSEAAGRVSEKVTGGSVDLDEAEIRTLLIFLNGLGLIAGMVPGMIRDDAAAQLKELLPQIEDAKRKLDN
ncbi:hypothetical protein MKK69_21995 [Methylobacterium sp. J-026]|uniref:hypothetical protein n=1 Tax=Methylobacterium sp. J-026 TaxID=2836624 RepID=UPI001FBBAD17|nr:hypothetical protein [Methylobacterium sp. J-026]MCJ2136687.1 hypothetical protein [Methylobacterium sp. J-026]